jgi:hypothetical protein
MGTRARVVAALGVSCLVACSTFRSDPGVAGDSGAPAPGTDASDSSADAGGDTADGGCRHTFCQEFDGPLLPPWNLSNDIGSAQVVGGELSMVLPSGFGAAAVLVSLPFEPPVSRVRCEIAVRIDEAPTTGSVSLIALETETAWVYVAATLSPTAVDVDVGIGQATMSSIRVGSTNAIPKATWTTIALEAGDGIAPRYTQGAVQLNASETLKGGKITKAYFSLKRQAAAPAGEEWRGVFDHAYCDVVP